MLLAMAVPGVAIGLRLQPGIGDALLCARSADSIGRGGAGAAAGGGNAATTAAATMANANMPRRRSHSTAQTDRCHGCQRRRRRRRGRAETQIGGETIVMKLGGILDRCLIR